MACYHPRYGYRAERGLIRRNTAWSGAWRGLLTLACGQCVGCRAEQKRQWGVRGMHELQMIPEASFVTLTYADEHLPEFGNLTKRDWQDFAKALRHKMGPFRFLMCGEYGSAENTERCHFHAIIYGHDFVADRIPYKKNNQGHQLFTSPTLEKIWDKGFSTIGNVSFDSVSYTASYIQKRVTGKDAKAYYTRTHKPTGEDYDQVPEFALMSRGDNSKDPLRGYGLGHSWIERYHPEVYPSDSVLVNGQLASPPDYYDRWYDKHYPTEMKEVKRKRTLNAHKYIEDNSPERLAIRKKVFTAKYAQYIQR